MVITLVSIIIFTIFCEFSWNEIMTGKDTYNGVVRTLKFVAIVNIFIAIILGSTTSIAIYGTLSFYYMVIFKYRVYKLSLEHENNTDKN